MGRDPKAVEESWNALLSRLAHTLLRLDKIMDADWSDNVSVREIRVKLPSTEGGEYLAILKMVAGGKPYVLFNSAQTPSEAIAGAVAKANSGDSSVWKDDKPYMG